MGVRPVPRDELTVKALASGLQQLARDAGIRGSVYDLRLRPDGLALRDVLLEKGYDAEFLEIPEGHSVNA